MKHTYMRGFTLIELLVVVLIIGILASIAVPQYQKAVHRARIKSYMPVVRDLAEAEEMYYMANNRYASMNEADELDINFPRECKKIFASSDRLSCDNHVTLNIFLTPNSPYDVVSVGMTYCYDGSRPCGEADNRDIQLTRALRNQQGNSILRGWEDKWLCLCYDANDSFCSKVCQPILGT